MCFNFTNPFPLMIRSHYDTKAYRDAFHGRNDPCYLVCCSFFMLLLITFIGGLMYGSQANNNKFDEYFMTQITELLTINRSTIIKDIQNIYPSNLEMSISANKIASNINYPICIKAPNFLMPLLRTSNQNKLTKHHGQQTININELKKAQINNDNRDIFLNSNDWLQKRFPSILGSQNDQKHQKELDELHSMLENFKVEDLWKSIIGYKLDPNCFIRIDRSSNEQLKILKEAEFDEITQHKMLCKDFAKRVLSPSFIVINPDNGWIYQLTISGLDFQILKCISYKNKYIELDKMNSNKFNELISTNNPDLMKWFDSMNDYVSWILIMICFLIILILIGWQGYIFGLMLCESFISTLIIWIIIRLLNCFKVFQNFDNIFPSFKQIWRMNILLCVPDHTFVRIMELTSIAIYWRIFARVIITLLLIIDVYQHDPPHDKDS